MEPNDIDVVDNGALVKVFLLEAPLPWNADSLRNSAGNFWDSFALAHAGLGFLVEETDSARVIEFHADYYTDSFMPNVPPPPPTPSPTPAPSATPPPSTEPPTPTAAPGPSPSPTPVSPSTPSPSAANTTAPSGAGGGNFSEVAEATGGVGSQELVWNNVGMVRETKTFNTKVWTSATFVTKITGLLYNDLAEWAQSFQAEHGKYQPLSVCRADKAGSSADENPLIRPAMDSYEFAWQAFQHLASNGVAFDWEVVLPPKRTAMCLFVEGEGDAVEFVEANDAEAISYFRRTNDCVTKLAAAAANGSALNPGGSCLSHQSLSATSAMARESAVSLLLGVGSCLDPVTDAYVYHNDSLLLRVPLAGSGSGGNDSSAAALGSSSGAIPKVGMVRYMPEMPKPPPPLPRGGDRAWIVYVAVALVATVVAGFVARAVFRKRRALMAYGDGGNSGMLSSLGAGWRSGVAAGSDFGEFDGVGGGYEGPLFPGDNYGSGSMSGMMHSSGSSSRQSRNWRGGRDRPDAGSDNAENVELKRPLLHLSESPLMPSGEQVESSGGGTPSSIPSGRGKGRSSRGDNDHGAGGDAMGGAGGPRGARSSRDGMSPPPFSRIHGTIGAGPPVRKGGVKESGNSGGIGSGSGNPEQLPGRAGRGRSSRNEEPDRGTLGEDPFVGEGVGGARGRVRPMKPSEPEGDEVFC